MWEGIGRVVGEFQLEARAAAAPSGAMTSRGAITGVGGTEVVKGSVLAHGRRRRVLLLGKGTLVGGGRALRQGRPAQLVLGRSLLDAQRGPGGHHRKESDDCAMPQDLDGIESLLSRLGGKSKISDGWRWR